jgi:hypothetical protein
LFPAPEEDPFYRFLLAARKTDLAVGEMSRWVIEYISGAEAQSGNAPS